jgi:uncharacterized protein YjbI with pentapeptide repeats
MTHGRSFENAVLCGADFSGADLRGVSFRNADIRKADFTGCLWGGNDLRGANMEGAKVDREFWETVGRELAPPKLTVHDGGKS